MSEVTEKLGVRPLGVTADGNPTKLVHIEQVARVERQRDKLLEVLMWSLRDLEQINAASPLKPYEYSETEARELIESITGLSWEEIKRRFKP
jgi:hypothetical protein